MLGEEELNQLNEDGWKMLNAFLEIYNIKLSDLILG